jgi:hypothetical protein
MRFPRQIIATAWAFLAVQTASSTPITIQQAAHGHCDVIPYPATAFMTNPPRPAAYQASGGLTAFQFVFALPAPPASTQPNCVYEISDVQVLTMAFTFTGDQMVWAGPNRAGPAAGVNRDFRALTCTAGACIETITFRPHQQFAAFEMVLPAPAFPVTLFDPESDFTITAAVASIAGNHYYVPEPGTVWLLGTAILVLGGRACRKGKRSLSCCRSKLGHATSS